MSISLDLSPLPASLSPGLAAPKAEMGRLSLCFQNEPRPAPLLTAGVVGTGQDAPSGAVGLLEAGSLNSTFLCALVGYTPLELSHAPG